VVRIDDAALARFAGETKERTLYLLDVRSPEEYARGHLAGSRSAPGGQLVQATDAYINTRNARIVLIDDDGVRAVMTGSWLRQMGWREIYLLDGGLAGRPLVSGNGAAPIPELDAAVTPTISPAELKDRLAQGTAVVVDLARSLAYEAGHIPGAWFAVRARLGDALKNVPKAPMLVLASPDGRLARLAAAELDASGYDEVRVLDGGTEAWRDSAGPLATGREAMADTPDDCWRRPYDPFVPAGGRERYLAWETGLIGQLEREGDVGFRIPG